MSSTENQSSTNSPSTEDPFNQPYSMEYWNQILTFFQSQRLKELAKSLGISFSPTKSANLPQISERLAILHASPAMVVILLRVASWIDLTGRGFVPPTQVVTLASAPSLTAPEAPTANPPPEKPSGLWRARNSLGLSLSLSSDAGSAPYLTDWKPTTTRRRGFGVVCRRWPARPAPAPGDQPPNRDPGYARFPGWAAHPPPTIHPPIHTPIHTPIQPRPTPASTHGAIPLSTTPQRGHCGARPAANKPPGARPAPSAPAVRLPPMDEEALEKVLDPDMEIPALQALLDPIPSQWLWACMAAVETRKPKELDRKVSTLQKW
ncbi:hypothetical protein PAPYR_6658 [Paratrimastix pyriformis]|uniref:Uncharacterized protein n=1 Tax=Paratrimastix pyriformis TaxID=342808 RepID=A0ABQ8UEM6_9EUKA|nr:hypothetical protein PAPYR_6658 [Paratrimastix pyriformis]